MQYRYEMIEDIEGTPYLKRTWMNFISDTASDGFFMRHTVDNFRWCGPAEYRLGVEYNARVDENHIVFPNPSAAAMWVLRWS